MAVVDLHGFVADLKDHVVDHGFHVHADRHFVETYSNRQMWEVDMHPDNACGGPLDLVMTLEVEARTLITFEDSVVQAGPDRAPDNDITVPLTFGFILPPLADAPDLLILATTLAGIGGTELPLQVSSLQAYAAITDKPECTVSITSRIDVPLAQVHDRVDISCDLLDRAHAVCEFLLDRAPAWLPET